MGLQRREKLMDDEYCEFNKKVAIAICLRTRGMRCAVLTQCMALPGREDGEGERICICPRTLGDVLILTCVIVLPGGCRAQSRSAKHRE